MPPMPDRKGTKVRMKGKKRPRKTASGPHLSMRAWDFSMRSGVIDLTLPDSMMRTPKKWPMAKLHWSPRMAAHHTVMSSGMRESPPPSAAKHPAAKSSESPGRNGNTTTPVSMKMMRKRGAYTHTAPRLAIQPAMAARGSWMRSSRYWMGFMGACGPSGREVQRVWRGDTCGPEVMPQAGALRGFKNAEPVYPPAPRGPGLCEHLTRILLWRHEGRCARPRASPLVAAREPSGLFTISLLHCLGHKSAGLLAGVDAEFGVHVSDMALGGVV